MREDPALLIIGNSNVGKSTITKHLLPRSGEYKGKVGKTPGSTLLIKPVFQDGMRYQIVDLPGFGYLKKESQRREEHIKKKLVSHIEHHHDKYFLGLVVINVLRIEDELEKYFYKNEETIPLSFEMITFLLEYEIPLIILLNKIDKVSVFDERRIINLFVDTAARYGLKVVPLENFDYEYQYAIPYLKFSALNKTNLGNLKKAIDYLFRNS